MIFSNTRLATYSNRSPQSAHSTSRRRKCMHNRHLRQRGTSQPLSAIRIGCSSRLAFPTRNFTAQPPSVRSASPRTTSANAHLRICIIHVHPCRLLSTMGASCANKIAFSSPVSSDDEAIRRIFHLLTYRHCPSNTSYSPSKNVDIRRPLDRSGVQPDLLERFHILTSFGSDNRIARSLVIAGQAPLRALLARDEEEPWPAPSPTTLSSACPRVTSLRSTSRTAARRPPRRRRHTP